MKDFNSEQTPFDEQVENDMAARRAQPTNAPIRIGASDPPAPVAPAPVAPPPTPSVPTQSVPVVPDNAPPTTKPKAPMPMVVGLAMVAGAICVVIASLGIRRMMQPLNPVYPNATTLPATGNVVMEGPELVIKEAIPGTEAGEQGTPVIVPEATEATPLEEIEELPPATKPTLREDKKEEKEEKQDDKEKREAGTENYPPNDAHRGQGYEITPPPGFRLRQSGRRTIWQRDDGSQILVETGKAGDGSPRDGWERLHRDLSRRYGKNYRSLGIREGTLGGHPAAVWEFDLTGKDGITRRKIDIGIKVDGRGYAVLGAAPKEKFDDVKRDIESAIGSFQVKPPATPPQAESNVEDSRPEPTPTTRERRRTPRPTPRPKPRPTAVPEETSEEIVSPLPQPEPTPVRERGY